MAVSRLREQVTDWRVAAEFDQSTRVLKNVALTGMHSKNGYCYSEQALQRAARLYNQKPVFLDHADKPGEAASRSTRDLVGSIINPRFENERIRGDVRVLDTESGRTFLALAEGNAPGVGMSHVVLAQRSVDGSVVEQIEDVISVDVVVRPATTSTFRESTSPRPEEPTVEFEEQPTAAHGPADGARADDQRAPFQEQVISLLERIAGALEAGERRAAAGTNVQDEHAGRREAAVPAAPPFLERVWPTRISSAPRREPDGSGLTRAFVAAVRGK